MKMTTHTPPYDKVKIAWSCTSTAGYTFMSCCLNENISKFIFTLVHVNVYSQHKLAVFTWF